MNQDTRLCIRCTKCGSYAINEHLHGREPGKHPDLCDVCYWREEYSIALTSLGTRIQEPPNLEPHRLHDIVDITNFSYTDSQEQRIRTLESEIQNLRECLALLPPALPDGGRMYK